jgi:hypothetical protein
MIERLDDLRDVRERGEPFNVKIVLMVRESCNVKGS